MMLVFLLGTWELCTKIGYCQVNMQKKLGMRAIPFYVVFS